MVLNWVDPLVGPLAMRMAVEWAVLKVEKLVDYLVMRMVEMLVVRLAR